MGMANLAVSVDNYPLILSLRKVTQSILISLIFAAVIIAILYWYFGTEQGSSIRATGCNPAMSKAQGININFTKVLALAISNGLVGLSGGLMAQYQGSPTSTWAGAPSSSAWPPSLSARCWVKRFSANI